MKKVKCFFALLLCAVLLGGCGGASRSASSKAEGGYDGAYSGNMTEASGDMTEASAKMEETGGATGSGVLLTAQGQKLIRSASLSMESMEFDQTVDNITNLVSSMGGYVEESRVSLSPTFQKEERSASILARVPSDKYDVFLKEASALGTVVSKSESTRNVTLEYQDTESRKKALETEQESLLAILEKAGSVTEILEVQSRLSQVRYELESITSQLKTLDNQVEYSDIRISLEEVSRIDKPTGVGFFDGVAAVFHGSMGWFMAFLQILIGLLPLLIILGLVIFGIKKLIFKKRMPKPDNSPAPGPAKDPEQKK